MAEKIYCGNGKIVSTNYGEMTKLSFSKDDISKMVAYMDENDLQWINLMVKQKQNPQPGKPTLYLEVDTWKPISHQVSTQRDFPSQQDQEKAFDDNNTESEPAGTIYRSNF